MCKLRWICLLLIFATGLIGCGKYRHERKMIEMGELEQAHELLSARLTEDRDRDPDLLILLGDVKLSTDRLEEGVDILEEAAQIDEKLQPSVDQILLQEMSSWAAAGRIPLLQRVQEIILSHEPGRARNICDIYVASVSELLAEDRLQTAQELASLALAVDEGANERLADAFWARGRTVLETDYSVKPRDDRTRLIEESEINSLLLEYVEASTKLDNALTPRIASDIFDKAIGVASNWKDVYLDLVDVSLDLDSTLEEQNLEKLRDLYMTKAIEVADSDATSIPIVRGRLDILLLRAVRLDGRLVDNAAYRYLAEIFGTNTTDFNVSIREKFLADFRETTYRRFVAGDLLAYYMGTDRRSSAKRMAELLMTEFPDSPLLNDIAVLELVGALDDARLFDNLNSEQRFSSTWSFSGSIRHVQGRMFQKRDSGVFAGVVGIGDGGVIRRTVDLSGDWRLYLRWLPYWVPMHQHFSGDRSTTDPITVFFENANGDRLDLSERRTGGGRGSGSGCDWRSSFFMNGLGEAAWKDRFLTTDPSFKECFYYTDTGLGVREHTYIERIGTQLKVWDGSALIFSTNEAPGEEFNTVGIELAGNTGVDTILVIDPGAKTWPTLKAPVGVEKGHVSEYVPKSFENRNEQAIAMIGAIQKEWFPFIWEWGNVDRVSGGCIDAILKSRDPWGKPMAVSYGTKRNTLCVVIGGSDREIVTPVDSCFSLPIRGAVDQYGADFVYRTRDPNGSSPYYEFVQYPAAAEHYVKSFK